MLNFVATPVTVSLINDVRVLRGEISELTTANKELMRENHRLTQRIDELEQYQRSNKMEIKGVPDESDVVATVIKIGQVLDEPVAATDIDICHRVPTSKQGEKNIVLRFVHRTKRNALLAKSKRQRLNTTVLGLSDSATPVYVNEHLTREGKQLLGAAIARKKEARWKFVWTAGGKIFARKDETTEVERIATREDLSKIVR